MAPPTENEPDVPPATAEEVPDSLAEKAPGSPPEQVAGSAEEASLYQAEQETPWDVWDEPITAQPVPPTPKPRDPAWDDWEEPQGPVGQDASEAAPPDSDATPTPPEGLSSPPVPASPETDSPEVPDHSFPARFQQQPLPPPAAPAPPISTPTAPPPATPPPLAHRAEHPVSPVAGTPQWNQGGYAGATYPGEVGAYIPEWEEPRGSRRGRMLLAGALGLTVVLVFAGIGAVLLKTDLLSGGGNEPAQPTDRQTAQNKPKQPAIDPHKLDSEQTDPKPLALSEGFPDKRISVNGRTYQLVSKDLTRNCVSAGKGSFGDTLLGAGCDRVLRATFVDDKQTFAVTSGVAVFPDKRSAQQVVDESDLADAWFAPLPGPPGSGAEDIQESGGYAAPARLGRYITFSFAAYVNDPTPPSEDRNLSELSEAMRSYAVCPLLERIGRTCPPVSG